LIKFRFSILLAVCVLVALAAPLATYAQGSAQQRYYDEIAAREDYIKGLAAYELGDYDMALQLLNKAYVKIPSEAALSFALAETYQKMNDLVKASMYAKEAVELEPKNKWYRLKLADIYGQTGQNDATLRVLRELIETDPNDLNALTALASAQSKQKKFIDANKTLDRILRLGGENWMIYYEKFQNFGALEMRDSSIAMLRKMQEMEPENLVTLQILSQFYAESDDTENAKSVLLNALEVNKRDPETMLMLADVYISEAKWDSAGALVVAFVGDTLVGPLDKLPFVDHLLKVYRSDPSNEVLGDVMVDIVDTYAGAHPLFGPAHAYAAELYIELKEIDKAIEALDKTVALMPANEQAWQERIRLHLEAEQYDKAVKAGLEADEMMPDNPFIQYLIGNAYYLNSQSQESVVWLQRASSLPARNEFKSVIYTSLGDSHNALRDFAKADAAFEKSLELNPANDITLNNYAYSLSNRGDQALLEKARDMAERALEAAPDNASYLDTAGWIYYRLGDYRKARELVGKSLEISPDSAEVLEHMGDIMDKLGDKNAAVSYWKRALDLDSKRSYLSDKIE
jgi:tetratricopeptide (TPR) repeat protein